MKMMKSKKDEINVKNLKEKLEPYFEKFEPLRKNYCADCLGLVQVQPKNDINEKTCDVYLMDTGICDGCLKVKEVLNPLIYTTAKLHNLDIWGKSERIYKKKVGDLKINDLVEHKNFYLGVIKNIDKNNLKAKVEFSEYGIKEVSINSLQKI
jgi:hypothetical protein